MHAGCLQGRQLLHTLKHAPPLTTSQQHGAPQLVLTQKALTSNNPMHKRQQGIGRGMMLVVPAMKGVMHQHACWRQPEGSQQARTASQPIKQKPASMPCTAHKTSEHMPLFNRQTKLPRPGFGVE
jgi:hypothetical protein